MMEVILVKDVDRLGKAGQILTVKDGYARNYLIPRGLGLPASPDRRARAEALGRAQAKALRAAKEKAVQLAQRLENASCVIPMPAGDQDKLHGAVTAADIVRALARQGIAIDKHQVRLERPMTHLGSIEVPIKLHAEVAAVLKLQIVAAANKK